MSIIFVLIGLSLFVAIIFLAVFFWNVKSGQYDDDYTPSVRMLFDEPKEKIESKSEDKKKKKETI
ncbi:MAG: cbb3-type cytochrome oxidase assembly protein CcoS [Bacteroidales bacterium]|nr:cbb3-type cytochrome oxidase assembly protein CcoS [Bacteroidales bacterium]